MTDPKDVLEKIRKLGFDPKSKKAASYILNDSQVYEQAAFEGFKDKLVILDINQAITAYPWVKEYMWTLVNKNKDEYTKKVFENMDGGYFIWIKKGANITLPLQTCLMVSSGNEQKVYNMIFVEEDADVKIVSGCTSEHQGSAMHIGVTEYFLKENSKLNFTMVHHWNELTTVKPRSAAVVEKDAHFTSNYVCLNPVKEIQMYPVAYCKGENSRTSFNSLIYSAGNSLMDTGFKVQLDGKDSKGEVISRTISAEKGKIISRGILEGNIVSKAHLECKGLLIGKEAVLHAIPELLSHTDEADLSHEAAVGKIADKEITYLMSRGMTEEEAVSLIIRGFMDVGIFHLPENLQKQIQGLMDQVTLGL